MDYMIKLRGDSCKSDGSEFHTLMANGTSVHVLCWRGQIDDSQLTEELDSAEVHTGDYKMAWVDTFGSNTGQGVYETLCVMEASLRKLLQIQADIQSVDLVPDAGSGYKSLQTVLAYGDFGSLTGIRVNQPGVFQCFRRGQMMGNGWA
jgi:hypothetical protein